MLPVADALTSAGFHALIFDQRGTGHSAGANVTFGTHEPLDVLGALDYVLTRPDVDHDRVGVMGVGLGGSVAIMAAAEDDRLRAVVAEAPYASLDAGLRAALAEEVGLPWLLRPLATRILVARLGGPLDDGAPLAAAARLGDRPVLLIADDEGATNASAQAIYAVLSGPGDLWIASGTTLGTGRTEIDSEYVARVLDFWRRVFEPVVAAR
jgi:pimeloyl-ACP methyl ester carboxylesterase